MPRKICTFREHDIERGFRAVTLENETISVTVLPEKGADIYRLVYKPRQMDILWKSPWGSDVPRLGYPPPLTARKLGTSGTRAAGRRSFRTVETVACTRAVI